MAELTKDQVELMIRNEMDERMEHMVHRSFCVERHKEVTTLGDKIKSIDNRLWGLVVMGLVQLITVIIVLLK